MTNNNNLIPGTAEQVLIELTEQEKEIENLRKIIAKQDKQIRELEKNTKEKQQSYTGYWRCKLCHEDFNYDGEDFCKCCGRWREMTESLNSRGKYE